MAHDRPAAADHQHGHGSGHVRLDEADWAAMLDKTEREGELFLGFLTAALTWADEVRGPEAPPARRVVDVGSGPGVATCELARRFPAAAVVAVDGSPAMLERVAQRAVEHGVADRVGTRQAEMPGGLDGLDAADLIWASMSLHHVGDEVAALRVLRDLLAPHGLLLIAELGDPTRILPDELDVGRPGLAARIERASRSWYDAMRAGLDGSVRSRDVPTMVAEAGLEVVGARLVRERFDAPLPPAARRVALGQIRRAREQLADRLDADDLAALDVLGDADDARGVQHRDDVALDASRLLVVARRPLRS